jgi:hypothetical protein
MAATGLDLYLICVLLSVPLTTGMAIRESGMIGTAPSKTLTESPGTGSVPVVLNAAGVPANHFRYDVFFSYGTTDADVVRVGGETPIGGVWRTTCMAPERQVGQRCWLRRDYAWHCESE